MSSDCASLIYLSPRGHSDRIDILDDSQIDGNSMRQRICILVAYGGLLCLPEISRRTMDCISARVVSVFTVALDLPFSTFFLGDLFAQVWFRCTHRLDQTISHVGDRLMEASLWLREDILRTTGGSDVPSIEIVKGRPKAQDEFVVHIVTLRQSKEC